MRILIAEDDPALRSTLAETLARDGLFVEDVSDGAEALQRLLDESRPPIDVLVSDVRMPRLNGVELLSALRRVGRRLPVVLMTGFGDGTSSASLDPLYPLEVLDKPFDVDVLRSILESVSLEETLRSEVDRSRRFVLVAEDDRELREGMAETLREAGYRVRTAADGRELLSLLTSASQGEIARPDVVVTDVRMPRYSGLDILRAMRLADWRQPVIVVTGFGDPRTHASAAELGATVVLDKPFDADDLVGMVDIVLSERRPSAQRVETRRPSRGCD